MLWSKKTISKLYFTKTPGKEIDISIYRKTYSTNYILLQVLTSMIMCSCIVDFYSGQSW